MTIKITIPEFITHIPYTDNRKAPNKYVKINNQQIYNGKINRFSRAIVMRNLHNYISIFLRKLKPVTRFPIYIHLKFFVPINFGDVSRRRIKGKFTTIWKIPKERYKPSWDIENLAAIWRKAINDALVINKIIPDDNIFFVVFNSHEYIEISDFKDRKLEIIISFDKNNIKDT